MKKVIIAAGGTGGHIFPAIAIAKILKQHDPAIEILMVGAYGMEVELYQKHNLPQKNVWISGLYRKWTFTNILRNALLPLKYVVSFFQSRSILSSFKPDIVIGAGGYAAYPILNAAIKRNIPIVIQEQNAYPGLTNRMLAPYAKLILMGNPFAADKFDNPNKVYSGNPIRENLQNGNKQHFIKQHNLKPDLPTVLVLGGSLGAHSINQTLLHIYKDLLKNSLQVIWQCGQYYYPDLKKHVQSEQGLVLLPFIDNMADAYQAADLVVGRAGAMTVSELLFLRKPAILIPSPNVANDHQTYNARSLSDFGAAITLPDNLIHNELLKNILYVFQSNKIQEMKNAIQLIEIPDTPRVILQSLLAIAP